MKLHRKISLLVPVSIGITVLWWAWAWHCAGKAVPGLLDDGAHISAAGNYTKNGWWVECFNHLNGSFHGVRFYGVQLGLVGIYQVFFGHDLDLWYLTNFLLCFTTGILAGFLVWAETSSLPGSIFAAVFLISASPVAEAVRGNFGKVEPVMGFLVVTGLALLSLAKRFRARNTLNSSRLAVQLLLYLGYALFVLGCLSKESGKIISGIPIAYAVICAVRERKVVELRFMILGLVSVILNYLINYSSSHNSYTSNYFHLNFHLPFLAQSFNFYLAQAPEIIAGMVLCTLILVSLSRKDVLKEHALALSFLVASGLYFLLLLTFRFQVNYYLYIPGTLLAVALGLIFSKAGRLVKSLLGCFLIIAFLHTVPYNWAIAEAQMLFDSTNFEAMEESSRYSAKKIISLDYSEDDQPIQEWNLIRRNWFYHSVPPLIGGPPTFQATRYQNLHRDFDLSTDVQSGWYDLHENDSQTYSINTGDMILKFVGDTKARDYSCRVALPLSKPAGLDMILDLSALKLVKSVRYARKLLGLFSLRSGPSRYGWDLYTVIKPLRYIILDGSSDGYHSKQARIYVPENGKSMKLTFALNSDSEASPIVSDQNGRALPISVFERHGRKLITFRVESPGMLTLKELAHGTQKQFQISKAYVGGVDSNEK